MMTDDSSDEATDNPLTADERNFYKRGEAYALSDTAIISTRDRRQAHGGFSVPGRATETPTSHV